ncbi:hypothetical protein Bca101_043933 [Brassica carinata]
MNEIAAKISIREYQLITLHLTIQLVSQHLFHWKNPRNKRLYSSLFSWLPSTPLFPLLFLESIKECCKALVNVTANFLALMYSYLSISISKNIVPDESKEERFTILSQ